MKAAHVNKTRYYLFLILVPFTLFFVQYKEKNLLTFKNNNWEILLFFCIHSQVLNLYVFKIINWLNKMFYIFKVHDFSWWLNLMMCIYSPKWVTILSQNYQTLNSSFFLCLGFWGFFSSIFLGLKLVHKAIYSCRSVAFSLKKTQIKVVHMIFLKLGDRNLQLTWL